ncbi:calcium homeostasis modulator protein 6-like [Thunnus maccoyii]|uniref:calcium homeostasis modulator protein 6-like n=1 Tax=Thunnus maccoyii TaxID=8240 RepID=UPI001C4B6F77|nr:calcium homeostasis modulator protein 6-like [Thunnus maccoyii]
MSKMDELMMSVEIQLISTLKNELGDRPVVSTVVFAFILAVVEKMLGVKFACPCNPKWNRAFVFPFFLIPAGTACLLMMLIHGCDGYKKVLCGFLPFIVWMALMLLDGQYYVCGNSDWPGTFVTANDTYLMWCKPTNTTTEKELLRRSHEFHIWSQGLGNTMVTILLILLVIYIAHTTKSKCHQNDEDAPDAASVPL